MNRSTVLATATLALLTPLAADARPVGNPRTLSGNAPAAVRDTQKKAGLVGFLFRKNTAPPAGSKIVPRRDKRTPATTTDERTGTKKTTLFGILFGR